MQREFSLLVTHACTQSYPLDEQPGGHYCQRLTPSVCQVWVREGVSVEYRAPLPPNLAASAGLPGGQL